MKEINKTFAHAFLSVIGGTFIDSENIVWKNINGVIIGKRSVWTFDFRACWLEDTTIDNVKSWWCGKDSDYSEIFVNSLHERTNTINASSNLFITRTNKNAE